MDRLQDLLAVPGAMDAVLLGGLALLLVLALGFAILRSRRFRPVGFESERGLHFHGVMTQRVGDPRKADRILRRLRRFDPLVLRAEDVAGADWREIVVRRRDAPLGHLDRFSSDWVIARLAAGATVRAVFWDKMAPKSPQDALCVIAIRVDGGRRSAVREAR